MFTIACYNGMSSVKNQEIWLLVPVFHLLCDLINLLTLLNFNLVLCEMRLIVSSKNPSPQSCWGD